MITVKTLVLFLIGIPISLLFVLIVLKLIKAIIKEIKK